MGTKLLIRPRGGGETIEEMPAEIISYGYRANRPGAISFTLALDHAKTRIATLDAGVSETAVERNGTIVWAGPIQTSDEDDSPRTVSFGGEGLLTYLRKMHITATLTYSSSTDDQFTIARGLVAHHQDKAGGDFGIDTTAVDTSGRKRTRTYNYWEHKNVYDAVIELSEVDDGFDLVVNPATRALDLFYPRRGQRRADIVFDARNIRKFRRRRDATRQASQVLAIGAGEEDSMLSAAAQSSSGVARHGLTQQVISHKDVTVQSTLLDHANDALNVSASVPNLISITVSTNDPTLFSYGIGDEVRVLWESPYETVNEFQRIIGFDVTFTAGEESATLHLVPI